MRAKILIVEDEREMAELIRMYLEREGAEITVCETGEEALDILSGNRTFDIMILDINLPGMDGFELLGSIRRNSNLKTSQLPVMIVSAREADEDIIMGLGIGADEFIVKPFSPRVLVARVRALLRRIGDMKVSGDRDVISIGPFSLDLDAYTLKKGGERIPLSVKEFEVLRHLVENRGKACTPNEIYSSVWKNAYGDLTAVAVYIQRLRKKIEDNPSEPVYIRTIHGKGYLFSTGNGM